MTTTTEATTALATREYSLAELGRRIDLNVQSGWGLENGTPAQLNLLALYCQKHHLLPGDDVTLYEGHPWITLDGRVKLMRRHKDEYRGHATRPLSKDEKEAWGYDIDDLVIETTVRTVTYGEIKAHGKVSKAEKAGLQVQGVRHNPVAKHHPVEIATKRSLTRAERYTFGTDSVVDDEELEDTARTVILERNDPKRVALNAARYDELVGSESTGTFFDGPDQHTTPAEPIEMVKSAKAPIMNELAGLLEAAAAGGIDTAAFTVKLPAPLSEVRQKIAAAQQAIGDVEGEGAAQQEAAF